MASRQSSLQKRMVEAKKNERANALKELKRLYKVDTNFFETPLDTGF